MSDNKPVHPKSYPTQAAQEVILEIVKSGALEKVITGTTKKPKEAISDFLISIHKDLTEYYETLK